MYKPLFDDLRRSAKHAAASDWACTLWMFVLPQTDSAGRLPASPVLVKSTCFPLRRTSHATVERGLQELAHVGLVHFYLSGGERYLIVHDHDQWVKELRKLKPKYPSPPADLCRCCRSKPSKEVAEEAPQAPIPFPSCAVQGGLERVQGKPGGSTAPGEPVRLVAARAFKGTNGWGKALPGLAEHFVSLEAAGVDAEFVTVEIPKRFGEAPWTCCDRVREAWKVEQRRRAEASRPQPPPPPTPAAPTIPQLEKYRDTLLTCRSKGMQVGQEHIDDVERRIAELRAADTSRASK